MKFWTAITVTVLLGLLVAQLVVFLPFTIDDAYITFSHAKNLVDGHGLVFSRGTRVEATSSFLWAILVTPFEALLPQGALLGSKLLGVLSICGTLWAGILLIRELIGTSSWTWPLSLLYSFTIIANSSFITWSTYGMENGLMAFLLMMAAVLFVRESHLNKGILSAVLLLLVEMCRAEGFMFVTIFAALRLFEFATCRHQHARARCIRWFIVLACSIGAYEAFGLAYYGHFLPNSATAKIPMLSWDTLVRGKEYLTEGPAALFVLVFATLSLLLPYAAFSASRGNSSFRSAVSLLWLCIVAQMAFSLVVGGDWMPNSRFLSHVFPLLLVLTILTIWRIVDKAKLITSSSIGNISLSIAAICAVVGYVANNVEYSKRSWKFQNLLERAEEQGVRAMAEKLNELDPSGSEVVACSDIGRMGYYYRGRVMDWFGLADEEIAQQHLPLSEQAASITLTRAPTFLVLYSNKPTLDASTMEFGEALHSRVFFNNPELSKSYEQIYALPFWQDRYQILFRRKS